MMQSYMKLWIFVTVLVCSSLSQAPVVQGNPPGKEGPAFLVKDINATFDAAAAQT